MRYINLGKGSKAVSGATSVGDNVKVGLVLVLVDTNNKHGSVFAWGRDNNLLGTTLKHQIIHSVKRLSSNKYTYMLGSNLY